MRAIYDLAVSHPGHATRSCFMALVLGSFILRVLPSIVLSKR